MSTALIDYWFNKAHCTILTDEEWRLCEQREDVGDVVDFFAAQMTYELLLNSRLMYTDAVFQMARLMTCVKSANAWTV